MARAGKKYYVIVNKTTGVIDENCIECRTVSTTTSQPTPVVSISHTVLNLNRSVFIEMNEWDHSTNKFKNKWSKGQGKPVKDI